MECFSDSKYQLLGYSQQLNRYIFTSRAYNDNMICVKEALIRTKTGIVRLSEGNMDNKAPEYEIEIFHKR